MSRSLQGLLLRFPTPEATAFGAAPRAISAAARHIGFEVEPLFATADGDAPLEARPGVVGVGVGGHQWYAFRPTAGDGSAANSWDDAHELEREIVSSVRLDGGRLPDLIEPDLLQQWPHESASPGGALAAAAGAACKFEDQDQALPFRPKEFAWHLSDEFSQLRSARSASAGHDFAVRIAHLDTGYDPKHNSFPKDQIESALQRNFVAGQPPNDASDPGEAGLMRNPGHGAGTLSILAGGRFAFSGNGYAFHDVLGAAPDAKIVPVRVGNSVVQLTTSSVAQGINYAAELAANPATRVDVISMSMGGVASAAWADAVNKAYEAGIVFVAAAGNNLSAGPFGLPTTHVVYPARFRRVIAACGVMADRTPYYGLPFGTMQGNWGPAGAMETALAAFTPNIAWARFGCRKIVRMNGQGTSSATPQIAAAAALYLQAHADELFDSARYPQPWMRVEAVRDALFRAAERVADTKVADKLGRGILRAMHALAIAPAPARELRKTKSDRAGWPFLNVLSRTGLRPSVSDRMLALEAMQLYQQWPRVGKQNPFEAAIADPDRDGAAGAVPDVRKFLELVCDHPAVSNRLKTRAQQVLDTMPRTTVRSRRRGKQPEQPPERPAPLQNTSVPFVPPQPPYRTLRGYAFDPSLTTVLATIGISEVAFKVPWESLAPGPTGEYLEVVDVDPASGCFYEPVDLDSPTLLAQDGLAPSEGTPQFHQQMVYAVASLTIANFERALGRKALWRPGPPPAGRSRKDDSHYVQRLRIYPHALREENAYYSPQKVALLFGYFEAQGDESGDHMPGGQVFTCLSHDIVAHETAHALLDGMHRKFILPSNPDVRAFHEAIADCVALFQHFTFPEIVSHQIATTRGDISREENLLGQLATQFGRATGHRTALRDAIGKVEHGKWRPHVPDPQEYEHTTQPHARGGILVAAIFDAFLSIYRNRTADLFRLASEGTGILRSGAIHPDLTQRLAAEAAKSAQHVLTMCIRALDYCPPTDITFGEFLRAIITADYDLVADDDLNYRVAFVEAFRRRGIYPASVRTLSVGSLLWRGAEEERPGPSAYLLDGLELFRQEASKFGYVRNRGDIFDFQRKVRSKLHQRLKMHFEKRPEGPDDAAFLGLDPRLSFEVHTARFANRVGPDGGITPQLIMALLQEQQIPADPHDPAGPKIPFEGGCTIIADLREKRIRYCIRKSVTSQSRQSRQQLAMAERDGLRATYLGVDSLGVDQRGSRVGDEPFALIHRGL